MTRARAKVRGRTRPATVLQIVPELSTGGAELSTIEIAAALNRAGARALVATSGGHMLDRLKQAGGEWIEFPAASKNPLRMAANAFVLKELCIAEKVSLIHARSRAPAWSARAAARMLKIPFVTTYHGAFSEPNAAKRLYNSVMAGGDAVIANSEYTAGLIRARYGTPGERIAVIHRGIDAAHFGRKRMKALYTAQRYAWGIEDASVRILLQPARLTAWKGQEVTIEAMRQLRDRGVGGIVCVLAGADQGRGGYRRKLEDLIAAYGLDGMVKLPGHCDDMGIAFALADLVLVPSTAPEAFGRAAVEAQAAGCPVIVSDLGAAPETVLAPPGTPASKRTGWRVPPGDAGALAEAIAAALALSRGSLAAIGRRGQAHVTAAFSLEGMQRRTLEVYDRLLGTDLAQRFERP